MSRLVQDFKIDGKWVKYKGSYEKQIQTLSSQIWNAMHMRCKSGNEGTANSTYKGCSISENFKDFQFFAEWCQSQSGYGNKDENGRHWELDKDILIRNNKVYGEDFCVFVPLEINVCLSKKVSQRGGCPIGVHYDNTKKTYVAQVNINRKRVFLGYFKNPESAFEAYKKAKEDRIRGLAIKYANDLDSRVHSALMNYSVEITD